MRWLLLAVYAAAVVVGVVLAQWPAVALVGGGLAAQSGRSLPGRHPRQGGHRSR
jgi:hypothetical protein